MEQWVCGGMGEKGTVARGCIEKEDEEETTKKRRGKDGKIRKRKGQYRRRG